MIVPLPCVTAHVTPVLVDPEIVAANCCCHISGNAVEVGEILMATVCELTATEAETDFVRSAVLTAFTV